MTRKLTERHFDNGQTEKIRPSDGYGRGAVTLAVERWYDFPEFGGYLGNVGSNWDITSWRGLWQPWHRIAILKFK